ncbi:MAG: energy transducer TonB [Agriterribacter sp.]
MVNILDSQTLKVTISDKPLHYIAEEKTGDANKLNMSKNGNAETKSVATDDDDKIFTKVEEEAYFPGGNDVFKVYLQENLNTNIPKKNGAPAGTYKVVVQFIVAKDGTISDVKALDKPGYGMDNEAVRVIEGGPKWVPGKMGRPVKSYKKQPITFIVSN